MSAPCALTTVGAADNGNSATLESWACLWAQQASWDTHGACAARSRAPQGSLRAVRPHARGIIHTLRTQRAQAQHTLKRENAACSQRADAIFDNCARGAATCCS